MISRLNFNYVPVSDPVSKALTTDSGTIKAATPFFLNPISVDQDYTLDANTNAMSAGPLTIGANVTVTISEGSEWTVV